MAATLDLLAATVGPDRLGLVHANDSRDACGSLRDRHQNLGHGSIGEDAFAELLRHPSMAGVPVIVETPSKDHAGHAGDIATLDRLARAGGPVNEAMSRRGGCHPPRFRAPLLRRG